MKYKEIGFRAIYRNFAVVSMNEHLKALTAEFSEAAQADGVLVYGYIDDEGALSLELVAAALKEADSWSFGEPAADRISTPIGSVQEEDFTIMNDRDALLARYIQKISPLDEFFASEVQEETRNLEFLDSSRHGEYPDDIMIRLIKEGLQTEVCWAHIFGAENGSLVTCLLNEPSQPFGCHRGDRLSVFTLETEEKEIVCCADLSQIQTLSYKDLEDGNMLRDAIIAFNSERSQDNLMEVIQLLRDSFVWIPCNAVVSEEDQKKMEEMIANAGDNPESIVGMKFPNSESIRLIPDILQSDEDFFFPVFSSCEEMGEYGNHFSKVQKHFLDVVNLAKNNDRELKGIVVNAFSNSFIFFKDGFALIESMKSRIDG